MFSTYDWNKALFSTLNDCNGGMVIFGDRATARIIGKGSVNIFGLHAISNVFYVKHLKSNFLSISQIHDADFNVNFV